MIFWGSCQQAFIFVLEDFLAGEVVEDSGGQGIICTEFESDFRDAAYRDGIFAVGVSERFFIPWTGIVFKPESNFAVGKLFNGIVAPVAAEAENIFSAAAMQGVITDSPDDYIVIFFICNTLANKTII